MKLLASHVRIGNIAVLSGELIKITNDDISLMFIKEECNLESSYCPVKITEEWLLKFGFTGDVNSGFGKDDIELNYITTDDHFEFEYKTSSKSWMLVPIKYVHQLQNLYFSLTGTELEIK